MKIRFPALVAGALLSLSATFAFAGVETATNDNDVILAGYDAVAYFTESKAVKGSAEFTAQHDGAVYRFSSAKNRDAFRADPNKYEPAYGGYCAYGAALGKKFEVNGEAFEVVEGRLYVNKSKNVYKEWKKDIPTNIVKAEGNWPTIEGVAADQL